MHLTIFFVPIFFLAFCFFGVFLFEVRPVLKEMENFAPRLAMLDDLDQSTHANMLQT